MATSNGTETAAGMWAAAHHEAEELAAKMGDEVPARDFFIEGVLWALEQEPSIEEIAAAEAAMPPQMLPPRPAIVKALRAARNAMWKVGP